MDPCAACGRPLAAGARFCTACGANVTAVPPAPPAGAPPRGPVGRTQEPWVVPVLALVTLTVYQFFWLWRVTREVDAWRSVGRHAHAAARWSIAFALAGALFLVGGLAAFVMLVPPSVAEDPDADPFAGLSAGQGLGLLGALVAGLVLSVVGMVWTYVAFWRVWTALEADAQRRGTKPISPALMLLLMLIPYVNLVGTFWVLWRTQKELNAAWAATPPEVVPRPA